MRKALALVLVICVLSPFSFGQEKEEEEDYLRWAREYEKAKSRLLTWSTIEIGGAAGFIGATALYFMTQKEEVHYYGRGIGYTEKIKHEGYLIGALIGAGIGLIGFILAEPARGRVRALEIEGRKKGYMTVALVPIKKGFALSLSIAF